MLARLASCSRSYSTSRAVCSVVPVIDFGKFINGGAKDQLAVAQQIGDACEHIGFLVIRNHQVPSPVIDAAWGETRKFFDLTEVAKESYKSVNEAEYPYGYVGFGKEVLSAGKDKEAGRAIGSTPDLKECFSMGPYNPLSGMPAPRLPTTPAAFAASWLAYYKAMETLSAHLLHAFALALELPPNWFVDKTDKHRCAMRALNYPELLKAPEPGQLRASAHTDYGTLTILRPDDAPGGLQVLPKGEDWTDVPFIPDAYVINLGDLMARWTNDKWVSTMHRVVTPPLNAGRPCRRQSIAFFHNINADHVVSCIATCTDKRNPPKYAPIAAFDLLMQKHLASLGYNFSAMSLIQSPTPPTDITGSSYIVCKSFQGAALRVKPWTAAGDKRVPTSTAPSAALSLFTPATTLSFASSATRSVSMRTKVSLVRTPDRIGSECSQAIRTTPLHCTASTPPTHSPRLYFPSLTRTPTKEATAAPSPHLNPANANVDCGRNPFRHIRTGQRQTVSSTTPRLSAPVLRSHAASTALEAEDTDLVRYLLMRFATEHDCTVPSSATYGAECAGDSNPSLSAVEGWAACTPETLLKEWVAGFERDKLVFDSLALCCEMKLRQTLRCASDLRLPMPNGFLSVVACTILRDILNTPFWPHAQALIVRAAAEDIFRQIVLCDSGGVEETQSNGFWRVRTTADEIDDSTPTGEDTGVSRTLSRVTDLASVESGQLPLSITQKQQDKQQLAGAQLAARAYLLARAQAVARECEHVAVVGPQYLGKYYDVQARTQALITKLSAVRADYEALVQRMVRMDRRKLHVVFVLDKWKQGAVQDCFTAWRKYAHTRTNRLGLRSRACGIIKLMLKRSMNLSRLVFSAWVAHLHAFRGSNEKKRILDLQNKLFTYQHLVPELELRLSMNTMAASAMQEHLASSSAHADGLVAELSRVLVVLERANMPAAVRLHQACCSAATHAAAALARQSTHQLQASCVGAFDGSLLLDDVCASRPLDSAQLLQAGVRVTDSCTNQLLRSSVMKSTGAVTVLTRASTSGGGADADTLAQTCSATASCTDSAGVLSFPGPSALQHALQLQQVSVAVPAHVLAVLASPSQPLPEPFGVQAGTLSSATTAAHCRPHSNAMPCAYPISPPASALKRPAAVASSGAEENNAFSGHVPSAHKAGHVVRFSDQQREQPNHVQQRQQSYFEGRRHSFAPPPLQGIVCVPFEGEQCSALASAALSLRTLHGMAGSTLLLRWANAVMVHAHAKAFRDLCMTSPGTSVAPGPLSVPIPIAISKHPHLIGLGSEIKSGVSLSFLAFSLSSFAHTLHSTVLESASPQLSAEQMHVLATALECHRASSAACVSAALRCTVVERAPDRAGTSAVHSSLRRMQGNRGGSSSRFRSTSFVPTMIPEFMPARPSLDIASSRMVKQGQVTPSRRLTVAAPISTAGTAFPGGENPLSLSPVAIHCPLAPAPPATHRFSVGGCAAGGLSSRGLRVATGVGKEPNIPERWSVGGCVSSGAGPTSPTHAATPSLRSALSPRCDAPRHPKPDSVWHLFQAKDMYQGNPTWTGALLAHLMHRSPVFALPCEFVASELQLLQAFRAQIIRTSGLSTAATSSPFTTLRKGPGEPVPAAGPAPTGLRQRQRRPSLSFATVASLTLTSTSTATASSNHSTLSHPAGATCASISSASEAGVPTSHVVQAPAVVLPSIDAVARTAAEAAHAGATVAALPQLVLAVDHCTRTKADAALAATLAFNTAAAVVQDGTWHKVAALVADTCADFGANREHPSPVAGAASAAAPVVSPASRFGKTGSRRLVDLNTSRLAPFSRVPYSRVEDVLIRGNTPLLDHQNVCVLLSRHAGLLEVLFLHYVWLGTAGAQASSANSSAVKQKVTSTPAYMAPTLSKQSALAQAQAQALAQAQAVVQEHTLSQGTLTPMCSLAARQMLQHADGDSVASGGSVPRRESVAQVRESLGGRRGTVRESGVKHAMSSSSVTSSNAGTGPCAGAGANSAAIAASQVGVDVMPVHEVWRFVKDAGLLSEHFTPGDVDHVLLRLFHFDHRPSTSSASHSLKSQSSSFRPRTPQRRSPPDHSHGPVLGCSSPLPPTAPVPVPVPGPSVGRSSVVAQRRSTSLRARRGSSFGGPDSTSHCGSPTSKGGDGQEVHTQNRRKLGGVHAPARGKGCVDAEQFVELLVRCAAYDLGAMGLGVAHSLETLLERCLAPMIHAPVQRLVGTFREHTILALFGQHRKWLHQLFTAHTTDPMDFYSETTSLCPNALSTAPKRLSLASTRLSISSTTSSACTHPSRVLPSELLGSGVVMCKDGWLRAVQSLLTCSKQFSRLTPTVLEDVFQRTVARPHDRWLVFAEFCDALAATALAADPSPHRTSLAKVQAAFDLWAAVPLSAATTVC